MSETTKRPFSSVSRSVSPPAVKRKVIKQAPPTESSVLNTSVIRVFSWNVNGVGPFLQKRLSFGTQLDGALHGFLKRHNWPQFLCLQEVKISSKDDLTQRRLQQAASEGDKLNEPTYTAHYSLPRDKYNATGFSGKVHGVATLVRNDIESSLLSPRRPDWDLEGRVLIHELDNGLVIINGYWVNGTNNPYRNPNTGVEDGTRHDHKLRFHSHMLHESLSLTREGKQVVLVGDMNVARGPLDGHPNLRTSPEQHVRNRFDFNQKFFDDPQGLQGIDIFRQLHGPQKKYTYHPRGCGWGESCDRVDMIIVTDALYESGAVRSTDICDNPQDRGHSDHVPLWIELDLAKLQDNKHKRSEEGTKPQAK